MSRLNGPSRRCGLALALTLAQASAYAGQTPSTDSAADLYQISLQDLMSMEVTSVSKREQKMSQVAAAIFVINQDDIRRSAALNIPDLLRMVPGLDVAQINASTWAISARGFNHQFSSKLLVLIDGRTVYTPSQNGVNWDTLDVPLDDIERIEVIRGPGATVWGTNAVNGVINVITKSTTETQGGLVTAGAGTRHPGFGTAQYGGTVADGVTYRTFVKYFDIDSLPAVGGGDGADARHLLHGGFRMDDAIADADSLTLQGDLYSGHEGAIIGHIVSIAPPDNEDIARTATLSGGNVLGRWNHVVSSNFDTTLQIYFDRYVRSGPEMSEACNTFDLDFHQHARIGSHHEVVWGVDYRNAADRTVGTIDQAFDPADARLALYSTFIQDEITLRPEQLRLTLGSKLEHNDFTGFEIEPSVRIAWTPSARETWWASVSDSARTPALRDVNADFNIGAFSLPNGAPVVPTIEGNPRQKSEYLLAEELGYRVEASDWVSLDVAAFFNKYRNLRSLEQGAPRSLTTPVPYTEIPLYHGNKVHGSTEGLEFGAKLRLSDRWTLSPGYAFLRMNLHTDPD
ncbi:MAG: iron complex outerrane recepter protein, partial [Gammaproteobacteria bacterium]|nr:iron complex outerrane recepter protein [Gammaproteobacteria bacterium]